MKNHDDSVLSGPFQGPLSGLRGIASCSGLNITLEQIDARLEAEMSSAKTRTRGRAYRQQVKKLLADVRSLRYVLESPLQTSIAEIALDVGCGLQRLGLWDDVMASLREGHRRSRQIEQIESRRKQAERTAQAVREAFRAERERNPKGKLTMLYKRLAEQFCISERSVRRHVSN